jgi:hypothetical protein
MGFKAVIVESEDHDLLEVRDKFGMGSFVFVIPMLVGLAIEVVGVRAWIVGPSPGQSPPGEIAAAGTLFLGIGSLWAWRALRRSGVIFDRARRVVSKWSGLVVPRRWEEIPFDDVDRIQLRYVSANGEGTSSSTDVDLILKGGRRLCVTSDGMTANAVDIAFALAAHTGLEVEDLSDPYGNYKG